MNNKPVAWMDKESNITMIGGIYPKKLEQYLNGLEARIFALETHLAKELTDDKIADLIKATNDEIGMKNIRTFDFTKVLLRKAQEK